MPHLCNNSVKNDNCLIILTEKINSVNKIINDKNSEFDNTMSIKNKKVQVRYKPVRSPTYYKPISNYSKDIQLSAKSNQIDNDNQTTLFYQPSDFDLKFKQTTLNSTIIPEKTATRLITSRWHAKELNSGKMINANSTYSHSQFAKNLTIKSLFKSVCELLSCSFSSTICHYKQTQPLTKLR